MSLSLVYSVMISTWLPEVSSTLKVKACSVIFDGASGLMSDIETTWRLDSDTFHHRVSNRGLASLGELPVDHGLESRRRRPAFE